MVSEFSFDCVPMERIGSKHYNIIMGNKVPISDFDSKITCTCFNKTKQHEIVMPDNLGDIVTIRDNEAKELVYRYERQIRNGHVYTKNEEPKN